MGVPRLGPERFEYLGEDRDESGDLGEVQDGPGDPRGGLGWVGGP